MRSRSAGCRPKRCCACARKAATSILKGDAADPNADLVYRGQRQVLDPAIKKGDVVLVGDSYVADWSAASATAH